MKNIKIRILTISLLALFFYGCNADNSSASTGTEAFDKDASYAFGMSEGMYIKDYIEAYGITIDTDQFFQGLKDLLNGNTRMTMDEAMDRLGNAFDAIMLALNAESIQRETAFLAENSRNPNVHITSSGLQYEIINETEGQKPSYFDGVRVHYIGRFIDGTVFDSSYEYGEPVEFPLYGVIQGWAEGLMLMSVGSVYKLYIPSELGYGSTGYENFIPPYSTLIFDVELLDIIVDESFNYLYEE